MAAAQQQHPLLCYDNNAPAAKGAGAGAAKAGATRAGARRRALGDVSNLQQSMARQQQQQKEQKEQGKQPSTNVTTRGAAAAAVEQAPRITRSAARARQQQQQQQQGQQGQGQQQGQQGQQGGGVAAAGAAAPVGGKCVAGAEKSGMSMSSLLQSRSEAACVSSRTRRKSSASTQQQQQQQQQQQKQKHAGPHSSPLPDIDAQDRLNPLAAPEYANDIHSYYKRAEGKFRVPPDYMKGQADINEKMRAILVDWLVEVHLKFKLMPETLFLAVNLIDRFLAIKPVTRRNLQLVGVTGMLIASKYEEIWAPEVKDFVYISDKAYTREQIIAMEKLMLNTLRFNLTLPTSYNFLARFLKAAGAHLDKEVTMLSSYLVELAQVDASMLHHSYSMQSAAALYVARRCLNTEDAYPYALARHSGYSEEEVLPCAAGLTALMQKAPSGSLNAVFKKYSQIKFLEIAKTSPCMAIVDEAPQKQ